MSIFWKSSFVCPVFTCPFLYVQFLCFWFCMPYFCMSSFVCSVLYVQFLYIQFCNSNFWYVHFCKSNFVCLDLHIRFFMFEFGFCMSSFCMSGFVCLVLWLSGFCMSSFCMFGFVSPILYQKFYQDLTCFGCFREDLEVWVEVFVSAFSRLMIGQSSPFLLSHWWRDQNSAALGLGGGVGWDDHTNNLSQNESNIKQPTQPN